jgi:hypothetical protein
MEVSALEQKSPSKDSKHAARGTKSQISNEHSCDNPTSTPVGAGGETVEKGDAVPSADPIAAPLSPSLPSEPVDETILIDVDDDVTVASRASVSSVASEICAMTVPKKEKKKAESPAKRQDGRRLFDFSSGTMNETEPLYNSAIRPVSDKEGMHLCCELGSLTRENAIHFIEVMKKKPDAFWLDSNVEFTARQAFQYQLPPRVLPEDARHLFRNFADSDTKECFKCPCTGPKRLGISRREMDIMLYFNSKGKSARDCHYLMPYRSQRGLRRIFEAIKDLGIVDVDYMEHVTSTVEKLETIESRGHIEKKQAPCIETVIL